MEPENKISAEKAAELLSQNGLPVTVDQAAGILDFLYTLVKIKLTKV